jgi:hypothetical protein
MSIFYALDNAPCAREARQDGPSLPDWYIRRVCGDPPSGDWAIRQARYSALALEEERETHRE